MVNAETEILSAQDLPKGFVLSSLMKDTGSPWNTFRLQGESFVWFLYVNMHLVHRI